MTSWKLSNWPWVIFFPLALFTLSVPLAPLALSLCGSTRASYGPLTLPVWLGVSASISQPSGTWSCCFHETQMCSLLSAAHCASHSCRGKYEDGQRGCCSTLPLSLSLSSELRCSLSLSQVVSWYDAHSYYLFTLPLCLAVLNCMLSHHLFFAVPPLIPLSFSLSLLIYVSVFPSAASSGCFLSMLLIL